MNLVKGLGELSTMAFDKLRGANNSKGGQFEYGLVSLLLLRGVRSADRFQLGSNLDGLGQFDDVFFKVFWTDEGGNERTQATCIQCKHKANQPLVSEAQLTSKKGNFSMYQYFQSYTTLHKTLLGKKKAANSQILQETQFDDFKFVIYTNSPVIHKTKALTLDQLSPVEIMISSGCEDQEVFSFGPEDESVWNLRKNKNDNEMYLEFLQNLRIFSRQMNVEQLLELITEEVALLANVSKSDEDTLSTKFMKGIEKWWNDENMLLTNCCIQWYKPLMHIINKRTTEYLESIAHQFTVESNRFWENHDGEGFLNIIVPEVNSELRCLKIFALLESKYSGRYLMINDAYFNEGVRHIMPMYNNKLCHILVINIKNNQNVKHITEALYPCQCKVILVSEMKLNVTNCSYLEDLWSMSDLTKVSQKRLLKATVDFQGKDLLLRKIGPPDIIKSLDPGCLSTVFMGGKIVVGTNIKHTDHLYMNRTLQHKTVLREEVLRDIHNKDIFAISGFPQNTMLGANMKTSSDIESQDAGVSIVVLSYDCSNGNLFASSEHKRDRLEYLKLCERFKHSKSVHWVAYEGRFLAWKESCGSEATPSKYIARMSKSCGATTTCNHEESLRTKWKDKLLLITGEPGMGKSSLLRHAAEQLKEEQPESWVIHVSLNKFSNELRSLTPESMTMEHVYRILESAADFKSPTCPYVGNQILKYSIENKGNFTVFLDAVDEVSPIYELQVLKIVQLLLGTKIEQLWVTSRTVLQEYLQKELNSLALELQPLTDEEQIEFLTQLLTKNVPNASSKKYHISPQEVTELLTFMKSNSNSRDRNLCGVPLYACMVADTLRELSQDASGPLQYNEILKELNIYRMYKSFIRKKQVLFYEKYGFDDSKVGLVGISKNTQKSFMDYHILCALNVIFSSKELKILNVLNIENNSDFLSKYEVMEKTGIIDGFIDGKPQFVHYSFCEYFVAKWYAALLEENCHLLSDGIAVRELFISAYNVVYGAVRSVFHRSPGNNRRELRKKVKLLYTNQLDQVRKFLDLMLSEGYPLHETVLFGDTRRVEELLRSQENVNLKDKFGRMPLNLSVNSGDLNLTSMLLALGSEVNMRDAILRWSPLKYADRTQAWDIALQLLQYGAKLEDATQLKKRFGSYVRLRQIISENEGSKPSVDIKHNIPSALASAVKTNNVAVIKSLLKGKVDVDGTDCSNNTAMMLAVRNNSLQIVDMFLRHRANVHATNIAGYTALMIGVEQGNDKITELLLDNGSNVNYSNIKGETALHIAAHHKKCDVLVEQLLIHGADVNAINSDGNTALITATLNGSDEITKTLLIHGSNPNFTNKTGSTALHYAVRMSQETVQILLEHGAKVNATDKDGNTPLIIASHRSNDETIHSLLSYGSNTNSKNKNGETALHKAAGHENREATVCLLLEHGADINAIDKVGNTALIIAIDKRNDKIMKKLCHKSNINKSNAKGETALHKEIAASFSKTDVQMLLEHGSDVNAEDKEGNTALIIAAQEGDCDVIELLISHGSDVNSSNTKGETALHKATHYNNEATLQMLLQHGADMNATDSCGNTALKIAVREGNDEIMKILFNQGTYSKNHNKEGGKNVGKLDNDLISNVKECNDKILNNVLNEKSNDTAVITDEKQKFVQNKR